MKFRMRYVLLACMLIICLTYLNCGKYSFTSLSANNGNNGNNGTFNNNQCFTDSFQEPQAQITNSVDILFVVHTTSSFSAVKQTVVSGLSNFVNQLPAGADYQIAVMPAHSPKAVNTSGYFIAPNSIPPVLSSKKLSSSMIISDLTAIMNASPNAVDGKGNTLPDGSDEEGLASLYTGLDSVHLPVNQAAGFFRPGAALAIVFLANEADMCGETDAAIGNKSPQNTDGDYNQEFSVTQSDCFDAGGNQIITATSVYQRIQAAMQTIAGTAGSPNPFLVGGVVFTNPAQTAGNNEEEYGWGYMDLIKLASGISVDINGNIATGLQQIGMQAVTKLTLQTDFTPSQTNIDPTSISVLVDGQPDTQFTYQPSINDVNIPAPGTAGGTVKINYCQLSTQ